VISDYSYILTFWLFVSSKEKLTQSLFFTIKMLSAQTRGMPYFLTGMFPFLPFPLLAPTIGIEPFLSTSTIDKEPKNKSPRLLPRGLFSDLTLG